MGALGVVFYNTVLDENAASHIAYGQGFANTVERAAALEPAEQARLGINQSAVHTDVMIGGPEVEISGRDPSETWIPILDGLEWVL